MTISKLITAARRLVSDDKGVTAIEYGLIATFIAVAIIGAVTGVGNALIVQFNAITAAL